MHQLADKSLLRDQVFIGGSWRAATDGRMLDVTDPATGHLVGRVPACGRADTQDAIEVAGEALTAWSAQTAHTRASLLHKWHELIVAHADDLALLMTLEQGKPLAEAKAEVLYGASFVRWCVGEAVRIYGESIPATEQGRRIFVRKIPVGVCAAITPWNFPNAMLTRKLAPALAAGCTVVAKPSELTPFSALALAELAARAGLPPGVLNIITGEPEAIGLELTGNTRVRKLSFTGSTAVGKRLLRQCADTVKRVSLELGGNAAVIIFDDADLEVAVAGVMASKFRNSGQTCVCANRIYVQKDIYRPLVERLRVEMRKLKVGAGTEEAVSIGPLINQTAVRKVRSHVTDAIEHGASLVLGGRSTARGDQFFMPTLLTNAHDGMLLAREETFGPVAALFQFQTESEVLQRANNTPFGLASYVFTKELSRAFRAGEGLECGMVGINTGMISSAVAPFGGTKESGLGREGSHYGIDEYLEVQTLHFDISPDVQKENQQLPM